MRNTLLAAVLLAVFLINGTAWAGAHKDNVQGFWHEGRVMTDTSEREYMVYGAGKESCGSWTEVKKTDGPSYWQLTQWVTGYLTAYSLWVEDGSGPVSDNSSAYGPIAWVDNYCQENPLKNVAVAAEHLIFAIKAN